MSGPGVTGKSVPWTLTVTKKDDTLGERRGTELVGPLKTPSLRRLRSDTDLDGSGESPT